MKLWPFPNRIQNIDPSVFLQSNIPKETVPPAPSPAPADRLVLYMVMISFQGPIALEAHRSAKKMESEMTGEMFALHFEGEAVAAGFNSSYRAISFCRTLVQDMERKSPKTKYKIGLHAGPVVLKTSGDSKIMTGTHAEILHGIFGVSAQGAVYASEAFAASLVLDSASLGFIHTGTLQLPEPLGAQSLYRVDWTASDK
jgi:class 3 adenylate cyclase